MALGHEIEESAWASDDQFDAIAEGLDLGAFADAAEDEGDAEGEVSGVSADIFFDLDDEFAGGSEDENADAAAFGLALAEELEHGENEGGGFTGPGLGDADDIGSGEDFGDGGGLDGGGFGVTGVFDGGEDAGVETERLEWHYKRIGERKGREYRVMEEKSNLGEWRGEISEWRGGRKWRGGWRRSGRRRWRGRGERGR